MAVQHRIEIAQKPAKSCNLVAKTIAAFGVLQHRVGPGDEALDMGIELVVVVVQKLKPFGKAEETFANHSRMEGSLSLLSQSQ